MSRIVFVTWDGGGNLAPALAIARELAWRGHRTAFLGEATQRPATEAAGQAFTGFTPRPQPAAPPATAAERQHQLMAGTWLNMSLADDLVTMLAREPADAVVIDCMLAGVLARSAEFGAPTAVLVPGLYHSVLPVRDAMLAAGLGLLAQPGVPAPDPATMKWENKDLVLVTTLHELDGVTADPAPNVRYVGPAFASPPAPQHWRLPWPAGDPRPLILASLSTMPGQTTPALLQHVLNALAGLPAHVLMTTSAVPPGTLTPPPNAAVTAWLPHQAILPSTSLMITHGGHGSVTAALANGVPLVCIPGPGADQPIIAERVEALGAGTTVVRQAPASELHDAARHVLATRSYQQAARRLARIIKQQDGAAIGASALQDFAAQPQQARLRRSREPRRRH
jgi:MGT family glycosyltransferase